jgi:hypothetical protein
LTLKNEIYKFGTGTRNRTRPSMMMTQKKTNFFFFFFTSFHYSNICHKSNEEIRKTTTKQMKTKEERNRIGQT